MTVAHVNQATGSGGANTGGTFTISVTAGNILVLCLHGDCHTQAAVRAGAITDSQSNTWTQAKRSTSAQTGQLQDTELWYCFPASTGTLTITVTWDNTVNGWTADCHQFSGVDTAFPFSEVPASNPALATNYTTTGVAPTLSQPVSRSVGGAVLTFTTTNLTATNTLLTSPSGFTADTPIANTGAVSYIKGAYKLESASTTESITWASSSATQWAAMSITLQPPTALVLDGSGWNGDATATQTSIGVSLTTTKTNDIIVLYVMCCSTTARTISSVTASGLTFTKRSSNTHLGSGGRHITIETWWALAATAGTKGITTTFSGIPSDDAQAYAFGVNGCDTSSPWDTNASLPSFTKDDSGGFTTQTSTGFSVNGDDRLVFAFGDNNGSTSLNIVGTIGNVTGKAINGTGANKTSGTQNTNGDYAPNAKSFASAPTSFGGGTAQDWSIIADALAPINPNNATGTITTHLTSASISASGWMKPSGTITTTLTKASISSTGWAEAIGTVSTALTKVAQSFTAKVSPIGTISTVLTKASISIHATEKFTGTISTALTKPSQSLSGHVNLKGTIATALTRVSQSVTGSVSPTARITTSLNRISQSLTGTLQSNGTITTPLQKLSQSASGSISPIGSISTNLPKVSQQANGSVIFSGTIATHLQGVSQHSTAFVTDLYGVITTRLNRLSQSASGSVILTGSISTQLKKFSFSAGGWAEAIGSIQTSLPAHTINMQAVTTEIFTGTITTTLQGLTQSLVQAQEIFEGSIVTSLDPMAQGLTGEVLITGTIDTKIGGASGLAFANEGVGELIIEGPILTSLMPFDVSALGAQLGTPGAGKWYSWRQTDN